MIMIMIIIISIAITLITMKIVVMIRKRQRGKFSGKNINGKLEVWKYEYSDIYSLWYYQV